MKITILDAHCTNPGDLNWDIFETMGELEIHPRTPKELTIERASTSEIILTNKVIIDKQTIDALPKLKYIGILATGTNVVDLEYARSKGITVTNIPDYSSDSVAQHIISLILHFSSHVAIHSDSVRRGQWSSCQDFSYTLNSLHELSGKTLGIVGLGNIGRKTAALATAFGMKICASHQSSMSRLELPYEVEWLPMDEVFKKSDFISLSCPLTEQTNSLVNHDRLKTMKKNAVLINCGRGPLIDENALAQALNEGLIAGAGLDVLSSEPPASDNPLLEAKNCVITPHIAWASFEARKRLLNIAAGNISAFLEGKKLNCV